MKPPTLPVRPCQMLVCLQIFTLFPHRVSHTPASLCLSMQCLKHGPAMLLQLRPRGGGCAEAFSMPRNAKAQTISTSRLTTIFRHFPDALNNLRTQAQAQERIDGHRSKIRLQLSTLTTPIVISLEDVAPLHVRTEPARVHVFDHAL